MLTFISTISSIIVQSDKNLLFLIVCSMCWQAKGFFRFYIFFAYFWIEKEKLIFLTFSSSIGIRYYVCIRSKKKGKTQCNQSLFEVWFDFYILYNFTQYFQSYLRLCHGLKNKEISRVYILLDLKSDFVNILVWLCE